MSEVLQPSIYTLGELISLCQQHNITVDQEMRARWEAQAKLGSTPQEIYLAITNQENIHLPAFPNSLTRLVVIKYRRQKASDGRLRFYPHSVEEYSATHLKRSNDGKKWMVMGVERGETEILGTLEPTAARAFVYPLRATV